MTSSNIVWHNVSVSTQERTMRNRHKSFVLWYTGLSGSGKSTLANAVDRILFDTGYQTFVLDGDNIRHGLNRDLGFSDAERVENIRRIAEVSKLFADSGSIVSTAFISPFRADRDLARKLIGEQFIEIFVDTPLAECELRDPKGLYKKARAGEIKHFTGIDSEYEQPQAPEIVINTEHYGVMECAQQIIGYLENHNLRVELGDNVGDKL